MKDSTFDNELTDRTFNETCCKENGVSYECMANCKDARGPIYEGFRMGKLQSRCSKFERIIENCIIKGDYKLLFAKYFKLIKICIQKVIMCHELIVSTGSEGSRGCCRAMTADCIACSAGITVTEFCESHPQVVGCKGI